MVLLNVNKIFLLLEIIIASHNAIALPGAWRSECLTSRNKSVIAQKKD